MLLRKIKFWYSTSISDIISHKDFQTSKHHNTVALNNRVSNDQRNQLIDDNINQTNINPAENSSTEVFSPSDVYYMHQIQAERGINIV